MDDNVMRVLQMLQEGTITAQQAETLIAALRGETATPPTPPAPPEPEKPADAKTDHGFPGFDFVSNIKAPKIDFEHLGERISRAVSKVQPEKIVKRIQTQLRVATQTGAHWGASMMANVRIWSEGPDSRPENSEGLPQEVEVHELTFILEDGGAVLVENPLGNVTLTGISEGPAHVTITKTYWGNQEELKRIGERLAIDTVGGDTKLDIKVSAPDGFRDGTVDIDLRAPQSIISRISTHFGDIRITGMMGRSEAVTTTGPLIISDLLGDVRGETASGDLTLDRVAGCATVATQSGDIRASYVQRGLSANSASGDVHAEYVEGGRVECKSVSGDVQAEHIGTEGPLDVTVESVSGDAKLHHASGNLSIKAVSGDVSADELRASRLQAQTVSGDVSLALNEPFSGAMQVNTVSGDVSIALPEASDVRLSLSTTSGDLSCEPEAQGVNAGDTLWTGQLGAGAGNVNVQTISGDVAVRRA